MLRMHKMKHVLVTLCAKVQAPKKNEEEKKRGSEDAERQEERAGCEAST